MQSIREVYKIGKGPSSSHTMGPARAAALFKGEHPEADRFQVKLYGSLAKTGGGHGTDIAVAQTMEPVPTQVLFCAQADFPLPHENTLDLLAFCRGEQTGSMRVMSVGGGDIEIVGRPVVKSDDVYSESSFSEIAAICKRRSIRLVDYIEENEGTALYDYLFEVWNTMQAAIAEGLSVRGVLPGGLGVQRRAQQLFQNRHIDESEATRENRLVCAYAFAVSEQNAANGTVVTAPTCGACSVVPAVLKYFQEVKGFSNREILRALAVGGLFGCIVKQNASVSGAECGCQAEIGTACSMAAAALGELFGMGIDQIEYAAEVALEHHLGLTCDPICGLVQIPCIERNAVAAMRAINALRIANFLTDSRKISFDLVVKTMYETGKDMSARYRETAEGGLAKLYR